MQKRAVQVRLSVADRVGPARLSRVARVGRAGQQLVGLLALGRLSAERRVASSGERPRQLAARPDAAARR